MFSLHRRKMHRVTACKSCSLFHECDSLCLFISIKNYMQWYIYIYTTFQVLRAHNFSKRLAG